MFRYFLLTPIVCAALMLAAYHSIAHGQDNSSFRDGYSLLEDCSAIATQEPRGLFCMGYIIGVADTTHLLKGIGALDLPNSQISCIDDNISVGEAVAATVDSFERVAENSDLRKNAALIIYLSLVNNFPCARE